MCRHLAYVGEPVRETSVRPAKNPAFQAAVASRVPEPLTWPTVALNENVSPGRTRAQRAQDRRRRETRRRAAKPSVLARRELPPGWKQQLLDWSAAHLAATLETNPMIESRSEDRR